MPAVHVSLTRLIGAALLLAVASGAPAQLSYSETLEEYARLGLRPTSDVIVAVDPLTPAASSLGAIASAAEIGGRSEPALVWEREGSWIEYDLSVPEDGLYEIHLDYYPLPGNRGAVQRELLIDGEYPFREARQILLPRSWADASEPRVDNQGNHVRPRQIERPQWRFVGIDDPEGLYSQPLLFALSAGEHTLRFVAVREPVAIARIEVRSPRILRPYAQSNRSAPQRSAEQRVKIQAESVLSKSDPTVRREYSNDLAVEPPAGTSRVLNVLGGSRWRRGNQRVTWEVQIPADGRYRLGMSVLQSSGQGLPAIRTLEIDGEIPFAEAAEIQIPYENRRQYFVFGGDEPYELYLEAGTHTLSLTVHVGPVRSVIDAIERTVRDISELQRRIILITGVNPDPNREWDRLPELIPSMVPSLIEYADRLSEQAELLKGLADGKRPASINTLLQASVQFRDLAEEVDSIPYRIEDLSSTLTGLVNWLISLREHELEIDYLALEPPGAPVPRVHAGFFQRIAAAVNAFLLSFRRDYTGIGDVYEEKARVVNVWIARGREWVEIIKEMADETFTADTGIGVNTNILPAGAQQAILLNTAAGTVPDAILGLDPTLPVDYGIRGALADLNQFEDYSEVSARFRPGALIPFHFRGADYAIPENQNFSMLYYRTDIMEELGLAPPETWDEVYEILPTLQANGMDFFYAGVSAVPGQVHAGLLPFLLQRGGEFYTDDQLSALDEPVALTAFRQWTDLYTSWKLPAVANFFNRFRTGEMPIGVSDYATYLQLQTGAPEIRGWWSMSPIPGIRRDDGMVDRSAGGAGEAAAIFTSGDAQQDAWEFLKWWTSTPTQARFGEELEALIGVEARWNTANIDAMMQLPWPAEDIQAIMEQWQWFREQPIVLGGYFTQRHVQFAWTRVVLQGENPRAALELAHIEINRELRRKQLEFGFAPPDAAILDYERQIERYLR